MEALRYSRLGRYEILRKVGEGSAGTVYQARDIRSGDEVALKTLNDGTSLDDRDVDRVRRLFLNEATTGGLFDHPSIAAVFDVVDEPAAGEIHLAMEYVDGISLAELLERPDPLPFEFVVDVISQVAEALDHVHARGVVHRDVKPANILITDEGRAKVTDFGIAELRGTELADDLRHMGSPNYLAPERVLGAPADQRSDVYALGVVLYQLLTRNLPFRGDSAAELVRNIAAEEPTPAERFAPNLPGGVQAILDRALTKEPEERYASAGELAEELRAIGRRQAALSHTVPAPPPEPVAVDDAGEAPETAPAIPREPEAPAPATAGQWAGLRPGRRLVVPLVLLGIVVLAVGLLLGRGAGEIGPAAPAAVEEPPERDRYLALLDEGRRLMAAGQRRAAERLFERAAAFSPQARRILELREEARRQAAAELASEIALDVAGLVGVGEAALEDGALDEAASAARRALELAPEDPAATALAEEVASARLRRARRVRQRAAPEQPPEPTAAPAPEPEKLRIEQPIRPRRPAPAADFADLKVDFYSRVPRGVLTLYADESQVLRRPFRFVEKQGFLRNKGVAGGFDDQLRLDPGAVELRVYLAVSGEPTRIERVAGTLPPGTIRTLRVRVAEDGGLTVELH